MCVCKLLKYKGKNIDTGCLKSRQFVVFLMITGFGMVVEKNTHNLSTDFVEKGLSPCFVCFLVRK